MLLSESQRMHTGHHLPLIHPSITCSVKRGAGLWIGARTFPSIGPEKDQVDRFQSDGSEIALG